MSAVKSLKELLEGESHFVEYTAGNLYYMTDGGFRFPVPEKDLDGANIKATEKSTTLMKWIRKAHKELKNA